MMQSEQQVTIGINTTPEQAWEVIKSGKDVHKWLSEVIKSCELFDNIRVCRTDYGTITEKILKIDHEHMEFKFVFLEQDMIPNIEHLTTYVKIISDIHGKALVNYKWTFDAIDDVSESQAKEVLKGMGEMGIKSLEAYILSN
ncbi:hypothetical protein ATO12_20420 [Aquimarina atlantica]|uniref:Polyketide cyclase n=1 Tax=Aquimarina atlantica TaxID=1317122 RepID=A0A023BTN2_9FLAO|nr:SRPBCC family protein [Aquimarina atlantica]EZH73366.1 hypothetical protein ATO12_20420 [Aquimarina atlantica]